MQGWHGFEGNQLAYCVWDDIEMFRGTEPILMDLIDRPEHLHAIAKRYVEVRMAELDILEAKGLLGYDQDRIHCTGGQTTALPAAGFDAAEPRAGRYAGSAGGASCSCCVDNAMFDEFVPPYYQDYYARFGMAQFGCCDPLHNRIDAIRTIPNVRKVSDQRVVQGRQGRRGHRARLRLQPQAQPGHGRHGPVGPRDRREGLDGVLDATGKTGNGCPGRVHAQGHRRPCRTDPRRLWEWCTIAERRTRG